MHRVMASELLTLVVLNTFILLVFTLSFANLRGGNWRSLSVLPAFLVALFAEMYGFSLTTYLLSGWLAHRYPHIDPFAFSAGQLWHTLLGPTGTWLRGAIYLMSYILIAFGFLLVAYAWRVLYEAQRNNELAYSGPYRFVRHPQYLGFILIMFGLLLVWPALSTIIMFPIMTVIYIRLARREERAALEQLATSTAVTAPQRPPFSLGLARYEKKQAAREPPCNLSQSERELTSKGAVAHPGMSNRRR